VLTLTSNPLDDEAALVLGKWAASTGIRKLALTSRALSAGCIADLQLLLGERVRLFSW
jgi:hypothetical protein